MPARRCSCTSSRISSWGSSHSAELVDEIVELLKDLFSGSSVLDSCPLPRDRVYPVAPHLHSNIDEVHERLGNCVFHGSAIFTVHVLCRRNCLAQLLGKFALLCDQEEAVSVQLFGSSFKGIHDVSTSSRGYA